MKKDIHPSNYRKVVFKDMSNDEIFITRSTVAAKETIEIDGETYLGVTEYTVRSRKRVKELQEAAKAAAQAETKAEEPATV